jgi:hypothetical protein
VRLGLKEALEQQVWERQGLLESLVEKAQLGLQALRVQKVQLERLESELQARLEPQE